MRDDDGDEQHCIGTGAVFDLAPSKPRRKGREPIGFLHSFIPPAKEPVRRPATAKAKPKRPRRK